MASLAANGAGCEIARALVRQSFDHGCSTNPLPESTRLSIGDIRELVKDLKRRGIGVVITDHNVPRNARLVDRACIIYGAGFVRREPGRLVADENVRALPRRKLHAVNSWGRHLPFDGLTMTQIWAQAQLLVPLCVEIVEASALAGN